jgi:hypothetical protein
MSTIKNNAVIVDACSQRLKALQEYAPATGDMPIEGKRFTRDQLVAIFQACLDTRAELVKSRAKVKVDLASRSKAEADRRAIEAGLKAWVVAQFGPGSNQALEFGYTSRKRTAPSSETKANAAKLAKATRVARGTDKGKKEMGSANPRVEVADVLELRAIA